MADRETDLMAEIAAIRAEAGNEPPPPAPGGNEPPATPTEVATAPAEAEVPPQPAAAPPDKIRVKSLADIIVDDEELPPSLRGQSGAALLEERKRLKYQHDQAGYNANQLKAELDFTRAALAVLQRDAAKPPAPAPEPPPARPSVADVMQSRVNPADAIQDPTRFATNTAEAAAQFGADEAESRINPRIEALQAEVQRLRQERQDEATQSRGEAIGRAYASARPAEVAEEDWYAEENKLAIAGIVSGLKLSETDPASFQRAATVLRQRYGAPAPAQPPVPSPPPSPVTAPAQAAPPVGAGKTAPVPQPGPAKKWNGHDAAAREQLSQIAKAFGRDDAFMAEVEAEVMRDPKTKGLFQ